MYPIIEIDGHKNRMIINSEGVRQQQQQHLHPPHFGKNILIKPKPNVKTKEVQYYIASLHLHCIEFIHAGIIIRSVVIKKKPLLAGSLLYWYNYYVVCVYVCVCWGSLVVERWTIIFYSSLTPLALVKCDHMYILFYIYSQHISKNGVGLVEKKKSHVCLLLMKIINSDFFIVFFYSYYNR